MSSEKKRDKKLIVVQSNDLVESYYDTDLNATEHKIVRYAYSKIKKSPEVFPRVVFSVQEFLGVAGISSQNYYKRVEAISEELSKKIIKVKTGENAKWIPWFSEIEYNSGMIYISFNEKIKGLLIGVEDKGKYLKYDLKYITDMRSGYTIRLYELLKQYAPIKKRRLRIDVLKNMLGIGEKYKQYAHFKSRILNQAKKELDEKKELTFEFEEIKEGRKVVELIFYISSNDKKLVKNVDKDSAKREAFIKEAKYLLDNYGYEIDDNKLKQWSLYGIDLLNEALLEIRGREIKNPQAYIEVILKSKYKKIQAASNDVKADNLEELRLIDDFVERYRKSSEVVPDWFVKEKFVKMFVSNDYTKEDAERVWESNEAYLVKKVNK